MSSRPGIGGRTGSVNPNEDICPVCKSNRYLNPNLTFLINPECYHTMCTSCVDRLFTSGPAPCPVAGCHKTLRKRGFHKAFFGDLGIEREVDVRKRVGAIFNRREDEFETLRDWNNYLEMVEDLVFNIVEGTPQEKRAAEEKLKEYQEANKQEIDENNKFEKEEREDTRRRMHAESEAAKLRIQAAAKEEIEEQKMLKKSRDDVIDKLANSNNRDARRITEEAQRAMQKQIEKKRELAAADTRQKASGLTIRGLKRKEAPAVEKPYDPFGGLALAPSRYVLQPTYPNDWADSAMSESRHVAGGYSLQEYYARTMFEAFSGLGVFIGDEVKARNQPITSLAGISSKAVASYGSERNSDDVF